MISGCAATDATQDFEGAGVYGALPHGDVDQGPHLGFQRSALVHGRAAFLDLCSQRRPLIGRRARLGPWRPVVARHSQPGLKPGRAIDRMEHGLLRLIAELTKGLKPFRHHFRDLFLHFQEGVIGDPASCARRGPYRPAVPLSRIIGFLSENSAYLTRKGCIASTAEAVCGVTHVFSQG